MNLIQRLRCFALFVILHSAFVISLPAAVPQLLNHQGRIAVNGVNFEGAGQFKFALVNADGSTTYWSNDNTSTAGSQPTGAVSLTVTKGLYAVLLGDAGMTALPATAFDNADVRLRVWFNDGTIGFQQITPDQRLAAAPFALNAAKAETVPDGSITSAKIANAAIGSSQLATGLSLTGNLTGNATTAGSFTGVLSGDVTGAQSATSVSTVGGVTAANVATGANLANAATNLNTASALVKRDASGNFSTGTITISGGLSLPTTSSSTVGVITQGASRLIHTFGSSNFFAGLSAGNFTLTGNTNTAIGSFAMVSDTTGSSNTATGYTALLSNTTGSSNTASGASALINNTTASQNVAMGASSLSSQSYNPGFTYASNNTAVGYQALRANQPTLSNNGINNTAVGTNALLANTNGANNIAIGKDAGNLLTTGSNNIAIGHVGVAAEANTIRIGTSQAHTYLTGIIHGNGSGLTGITAASLTANTIGSGQLASDLTLGGTTTGIFVGDGSGLTGVTATTMQLANVIAPPNKPVVAWGNDHEGQTTVPSISNVAAVAAGASHSIALLKTGTVVQWGVIADAPGTATSVTHIAAGAAHNLARKTNGSVIAWGDDTYDQASVPGGITTATNVSAGEKHSLVLKADGTVQAWGDNTFGQTTVPGTATNVTAIAAGYDHNLALKADGTVIAWGRNDSGQATIPGGLTNVIAIAAGAHHSLAVKSDGTVIAWGWDAGGQSTVPGGLTSVSKVAGGYAFSVALKTDGTLVTWGDNTDGQTTVPFTATQVTAIAAGSTHTLALRADFIPAAVARLDQDNVFTGSLGIKRTPTTNTLEVEGNASKTAAGNWLSNSDRRIKIEVQPVTNALEKLSRVRLVDFKYANDYRAAHPGIEDKRYLNVIAQEFAQVFPDDVKSSGEKLPDGSDEILQVDTYPLTIYSAAAVQELHRENELLKKKLADQEERLRKIEAAINQ